MPEMDILNYSRNLWKGLQTQTQDNYVAIDLPSPDGTKSEPVRLDFQREKYEVKRNKRPAIKRRPFILSNHNMLILEDFKDAKSITWT